MLKQKKKKQLISQKLALEIHNKRLEQIMKLESPKLITKKPPVEKVLFSNVGNICKNITPIKCVSDALLSRSE